MAVTARALSKRFGKQSALEGLALNVPEGGVYALVGPNGAGKTTALRILMGLVRPDAGTATVFGMDATREGHRVRARTGYVPERREFGYDWMRLSRLLKHHAAYLPGWDAAYARHLVEALEVDLRRKYKALSKGQARKVQLVMAMAWRPPLLLLDEPTDGLDPVMRERLLSLLAEHLEASPTTVIVSTHIIHEVERLADHVGVLRQGRLTSEVEAASLERKLRNYRVVLQDEAAAASPAPPLAFTPVLASPARIVRSRRRGREIDLTVWGEEDEVVLQLRAAGADVRDVSPLRLADAALALLIEGDDPVAASGTDAEEASPGSRRSAEHAGVVS
jgi:ABC-2 type transport system ATP-binding protein